MDLKQKFWKIGLENEKKPTDEIEHDRKVIYWDGYNSCEIPYGT